MLKKFSVLVVLLTALALAACAAPSPEPATTATATPLPDEDGIATTAPTSTSESEEPAQTEEPTEEATITSTPLPIEATPTLSPASGGPLINIVATGGLCVPGEVCRYEVSIADDGTYTTLRQDGAQTSGVLDAELLARLKNEIVKADFQAIMSVPFTEMCPTAYDGQEIIYTFFVTGGQVVISSCMYVIDPGLPLFQAIDAALAAIAGS